MQVMNTPSNITRDFDQGACPSCSPSTCRMQAVDCVHGTCASNKHLVRQWPKHNAAICLFLIFGICKEIVLAPGHFKPSSIWWWIQAEVLHAQHCLEQIKHINMHMTLRQGKHINKPGTLCNQSIAHQPPADKKGGNTYQP